MIALIITLLIQTNDFSAIQNQILREKEIYLSKIKSHNLEYISGNNITTYLKSKNSQILINNNSITISGPDYYAVLNKQKDSFFLETILDKSKKARIMDYSRFVDSAPWSCFLCGIDLSTEQLELLSKSENDKAINIVVKSKKGDDNIQIIDGRFSLDKKNLIILNYDVFVYRKDLRCKVSHTGVKSYRGDILSSEKIDTVFYKDKEIKQSINFIFSYPEVQDNIIDSMAKLEYWNLPIKSLKTNYTKYIVVVSIISGVLLIVFSQRRAI